MKTLVFLLSLVLICLATDDIWLGEDQTPGFIQVREDGDDLFYWLMRSRGDKDTDPLVVWLTGGPGCASELAVMYENGPWKINEDITLRKNPYSWNDHSNIVFVD
jgi:carboxypeptidase C (cathepsin A)